MTLVLAFIVIAWSMVAWASVFVVVPWVARSLLRYRLRRLRDDVCDGLRAGGFSLREIDESEPGVIEATESRFMAGQLWDGALGEVRLSDDKQPRLLLRDIELTIANVRDFSLMRMLILRWMIHRRYDRAKHEFEPFEVDAAPLQDQKYLRAAELEYRAAIAKHVFLGTPMGWFVTGLFWPFAFALAVRRVRSDDGATEILEETRMVFRDEVPLQPEEALAFLDVPDLIGRQPLPVGVA